VCDLADLGGVEERKFRVEGSRSVPRSVQSIFPPPSFNFCLVAELGWRGEHQSHKGSPRRKVEDGSQEARSRHQATSDESCSDGKEQCR